jgi:hypothetical protein
MALHHATEAQLRTVAGRGLDKKVNRVFFTEYFKLMTLDDSTMFV